MRNSPERTSIPGSCLNRFTQRSNLPLLMSSLVGMACLMSATQHAIAASSKHDVNRPPAAMSYQKMVQVMGAAGQTDRMRASLVGTTVQLKLKKAGPTSFVVDIADGISFTCDQRSPSFKGGAVRSQISNIEDTAEGNFMVFLQRCD
jgi:hypothetical protein